MHTISLRRRAATLLLAPIVLTLASLAHAGGRTVIESTCTFTPPQTSTGSGQCFGNPNPLALENNLTAQVDMGFSISIGGKSYNTAFINENGFVSFGQVTSGTLQYGSGLSSDSFPGGDLSALSTHFSDTTSPWIAAAYLDLKTNDGTPDGGGLTNGVMYQTGVADPQGGLDDPAHHSPPMSPTGLPPAFAIVWSDPSQNSSGTGFEAQLVIYQLSSAGDFAIRYRFGSVAQGDNPIVGSQAGYSLGSGAVTFAQLATTNAAYAEPYNSTTTDYFFQFKASTPPPPPMRCDVDKDGDIDLRDLVAIFRSLGQHVSATDPRDANGNRRVDLADLVICAKRCTRHDCAVK